MSGRDEENVVASLPLACEQCVSRDLLVEQTRNIIPLYAARLEHLTWATSVTVSCECGHVAEVEVATPWKRLPMWASITELARHLRCANCDEKGRAEVDARRALGYDGPD
jgi:hypothetical protein